MKEYWEKWKPSIDTAYLHDNCKLEKDNNGLQLFLFGVRRQSKIRIRFSGRIYAYRSTTELAGLSHFMSMNDNTGKCIALEGPFFIVQNSDYARKIETDSGGIFPASQLIHFVVTNDNSNEEIITDQLHEILQGWD